MKNKLISLLFLAGTVSIFSGCSLPGATTGTRTVAGIGTIAKTIDGGVTWETRVKVDDQQNIGGVNVLSFVIDPVDTRKIYIGTESNGLYFSKNAGETWEKTNLSIQKIYGIVIDPRNDSSIYVAGIWNGRGKIFHTENEGKDWVEVYSEPSNGTIISSLAMNKHDSAVLYAGTSEGMIFKTTDGGKSWINLYRAKGIIFDIKFDSSMDEVVYFGLFGSGVLRTKDHGTTFEDIIGNVRKAGFNGNVNTIVVDPANSGFIYLGVNGAVLKGKNFGEDWESMNILETARKFPIKSVAINPKNSREVMFIAELVLYKSTDGGVQWSTYQLDSAKSVQTIEYDPFDPLTVYMGFRKK